MQTFKLPTLDRLKATISPDLDADKVASDWMASFATCAEAGDVTGTTALFNTESHWCDMLALTWDFRTFHGASSISKFLADRLVTAKLSNFRVTEKALQPLMHDLTWIHIAFDFDTHIGPSAGIVRLVPLPSGTWKAHCMYTTLEGLKDFPEKVGGLRNPAPNQGKWEREREQSIAFENEDPVVLIIGAEQSGLNLAARLKYLDVRTLVVEKNARIGDNWRNRYGALCLHDPVWYDHFAYLHFPPTWPIYTPAKKLANWMEHYADALELEVWTSSTVASARPMASGSWDVIINRSGKERVFKVKHVVFATGMGDGEGKIPSFPGMEEFKGQMLHSTQHKRALDHAGKKVVVIGACTSAHDIAVDYCTQGVDVTMFQRSSTYVISTKNELTSLMKPNYWEGGPPVEVADRGGASFPPLMAVELYHRITAGIGAADKEMLDGLRKVGFRTNLGTMDTGSGLISWERGGGYYLDVGGSQMIIDGKIKLKNDSQIAKGTETGIKFEDGSELPADVTIFAAGLGDACDPGLNAEGEINGAWRDLGVHGLWYMMGNLALARFYSKHVALQIKAMEEGVFGERYSAD
ncbi:FAD/NAD(P)-binding domain-containing protein [Mycena capillaripes]|nr:FAD/NAD(P)-binding domain-containing protein [Mycena capillaripes]